jgi:putative Ca2+/H+ antiporter (TMEM165/GDT1 family)
VGSLLAALGVVFVAELGDKTQLVALGFGARHRLAPVLVGLVSAYGATNLLSVAIGGLLGDVVPTRAVGIAGGLLFLAFAAWTLRGHGPHETAPDAAPDTAPPGAASAPEAGTPVTGADPATRETLQTAPAPRARSVALSVAVTMFVAELGDKTMLATGTLAARGNPALVWVGATVGITLAGLLGVLLGRAFGARLPERATRIGSALLFAVFGVALLATNL